MRFMVMMIPGVYQKPVADDFRPTPEDLAAMGKFNEELVKAGVMLVGEGLHPPEKATRVSFDGGKPKVTDGPFAESKEVIGGYWIWQVGSREEAVEWARRCPAGPDDVLEIRQVFEPEDFGPDVARQEHALKDKIAGKQ